MDKDFKIGAEGDLDIQLVNGQLVISISYVGASGTVALVIKESPVYFLEKLKLKAAGNALLTGVIQAIEAGIAMVP